MGFLSAIGNGLGQVGQAIQNAPNTLGARLFPVDPTTQAGMDPQALEAQRRLALIRLGLGFSGASQQGAGFGAAFKEGLGDASQPFQQGLAASLQRQQQQVALQRQAQMDDLKRRVDEADINNKNASTEKLQRPEEDKPTVAHEPLGSGMIQDFAINAKAGTKTPIGKPYKQNPSTASSGAGSWGLTDEENKALFGDGGAVPTGKLSPDRINSRTAKILAKAYLSNPNVDMNKLASDAALMRNSAFVQRAINAEALPGILQGVVDAGKKLNYSDTKFIGNIQNFIDGQFNDPDLAEYMVRRNDSLLSIANTMRGVGMSDYATKLEDEVQHPSMSPKALEGWLRGQTASLAPRLKEYDRLHRSKEDPAHVENPANPSGAPKETAAERAKRLGL